MKKINFILCLYLFLFKISYLYADEGFEAWKINFKIYAQDQGVSLSTINKLIDKSKFLPNVIKYDRYQPEFYEDTKTYISKRTSNKKLNIGRKVYNNNIDKINLISTKNSLDTISIKF